ncbi:uncharacterized protein LOC117651692 [Thrips palmi]|uniref:Uncharacterized protein LOC117651692 n=1 Tax=Thrips palmi TaxID=161013 RepID=A0A6P9A222_THRPL|nr:uncharacterized protein LOC117651692 [Thrips palmi]
MALVDIPRHFQAACHTTALYRRDFAASAPSKTASASRPRPPLPHCPPLYLASIKLCVGRRPASRHLLATLLNRTSRLPTAMLRLSVVVLVCLAALLAVFVAVEAMPQGQASPPSVGADPCTWGPSYWCANHQNAQKCQTTSWCLEKKMLQ